MTKCPNEDEDNDNGNDNGNDEDETKTVATFLSFLLSLLFGALLR